MVKKIQAIYQKFSKREKIIFWATITVIGFLSLDRLALGPAVSKVGQLDTQIHQEESAIRKAMSVLLRKEQIDRENKQFEVFSVEAQNPEEEMVGFLKDLENIASQSSVNLSYVKPGNTEEAKNGTRKYFASLECEAQMEQIAGFFHSVESSTKLLKIEKYEIQPKSKDSSLARCTTTVSKTVLIKA